MLMEGPAPSRAWKKRGQTGAHPRGAKDTIAPCRDLAMEVRRAQNEGHHHETRVPGDPRRYVLSLRLCSRRRARTKDCKDFRNGRQPVHAAEHAPLRAAAL